jgi:hypothetical protein
MKPLILLAYPLTYKNCVVEKISRSSATPPIGKTCFKIVTFLAPNEHLFDYIALPII